MEFTKNMQCVMERAVKLAQEQSHRYFMPEHLLYGMTFDADFGREYEAGEFQVSVGGSCPDAYSEMLKGQAVLKKTIMLSCREVSA